MEAKILLVRGRIQSIDDEENVTERLVELHPDTPIAIGVLVIYGMFFEADWCMDGSKSTVMYSTDNGQTWRNATPNKV